MNATGWWSRRFTSIVGTFGDPELLRVGRRLAHEGRVTDLKIAPYEVTAKVGRYVVALGIEAIDAAGWRAIETELASRAVFQARLLAGEMPPEIEWVFAELGVAMFPESPADLHLMCGCPGWGDACEHAAAVLCKLADAFDDDPFLILTWNGRAKEQLLAALRRGTAPEPDPFDIEDEPLTATGFWTPPARLPARPPAMPVPPGLILRVATPPPVRIRRRDLPDVLTPAYEALADQP